MPKVFTSEQKRQLDNYTITNEPIDSIDLMERAANSIVGEITKRIKIDKTSFLIIAGVGNNGGDGLAIARILRELNANVKVFFCKFSNNISDDCNVNLLRFKKIASEVLIEANSGNELIINNEDVIIDCVFGSGLNRPVSGDYAIIIDKINNSGKYVISIDIPSGLFGEDNSLNNANIVKANLTLAIQFPPISSMFAENHIYYGEINVIPIGLAKKYIDELDTKYFETDLLLSKSLLKKRNKFDHKGNYGHALLIAGSYGKAGAAVLAAKACMKSGVGLLTTHIPSDLANIMQVSLPEAMLSVDVNNKYCSSIDVFENYTAIGIGPGLGMDELTQNAVIDLLKINNLPIVIDADALNILAKHEKFHEILKPGTILTPHPKEFERLFGKFSNSWEKIEFMSKFSKDTGVIVILKGGITTISLPNGKIYFNTRGNPGMSTAGSGDVLTGVITSLLAQKYSPSNAAVLAVFIHSFAGDIAKQKKGVNALIASDIINNLFEAFIQIEQ